MSEDGPNHSWCNSKARRRAHTLQTSGRIGLRRIYYVGLSKRSMRKRLNKHLRDHHHGKWDRFSFYQIRRTKYIKDVETLLLRIIQPPGNDVLGRFRSKYNLGKKRKRQARWGIRLNLGFRKWVIIPLVFALGWKMMKFRISGFGLRIVEVSHVAFDFALGGQKRHFGFRNADFGFEGCGRVKFRMWDLRFRIWKNATRFKPTANSSSGLTKISSFLILSCCSKLK